jgi:uncharacterized metal-binding protein
MNIKPKVGVVSCSGECCGLGTLSRVATRLVLEDVRAEDTVTICLPLFLAGSEQEREFAREFPTIAVDGCHKLCAKKAIEKYSASTAASVDVEAILEEWREKAPSDRREMDSVGIRLAERIAEVIAEKVDKVRGDA